MYNHEVAHQASKWLRILYAIITKTLKSQN